MNLTRNSRDQTQSASLQEDLNQFSKNNVTMITTTKQPAQLFFANLICSSSPMQVKSEWKTYRDSKVCPFTRVTCVKYPNPRTFHFFYCRSLTAASLVVAQLKLLYMLSSKSAVKEDQKTDSMLRELPRKIKHCLHLNFSSRSIDGLGLSIECFALRRFSIHCADRLFVLDGP